MLTLDVKSLFVNVTADEPLGVTLQKLRDSTLLPPERIAHLLKMCLRKTYFTFRSEYYTNMNAH